MNRAAIFSWNKASKSAFMLQAAIKSLGIPCAKGSVQSWADSSFSVKNAFCSQDVIINWGAKIPAKIAVNHSSKVKNFNAQEMSDKLKFFVWAYNNHNTSAYIPKFTANPNAVLDEMINTGSMWLARQTTKASGGKGISFITDTNAIIQAPLYVQYIKKASEYRCHFVKNVDNIRYYWQKKKRVKAAPVSENTFKIRNIDNGWMYSSINFEVPSYVNMVGTIFAKHIPLDFGAFDIIYNEKDQEAYVLEVNTAPGLIEKTAEWYATCFKEMF